MKKHNGGILWSDKEWISLFDTIKDSYTIEEAFLKHNKKWKTNRSYGQIRDRMSRLGITGGINSHLKRRPKMEILQVQGNSTFWQNLVNFIKNDNKTIIDVANYLDTSPAKAQKVLTEGIEAGYKLNIKSGLVTTEKPNIQGTAFSKAISIPLKPIDNMIRFAVISDLHAGSIHCMKAELADFFKQCKEKGIVYILIVGDLVAGMRMFRGQELELDFNNLPDVLAEHQIDVLDKLLPSDMGFQYIGISGNHDLSFLSNCGFDPIERFAKKRKDFRYLGQYIAKFKLGGVKIELHHPDGGGCFDNTAEILTKDRGWIKFSDLTLNDEVATMRKEDHIFEWQNPTYITNEPYDGNMIHFKHRKFDFQVTPNHGLWAKYQTTAKRKQKPKIMPQRGHYKYSPDWQRLDAKFILDNYTRQRFALPLSSKGWIGQKIDYIDIPRVEPLCPSCSRNVDQMQHIGRQKMTDIAEFIAWFVTEGSSEKKRINISQYEKVNPENCNQINSLLQRMGIRFHRTSKYFAINSIELRQWLISECDNGSRNKHLPKWLKNQPCNILKIVFETMIKGDGWINDRGFGYKSISKKLRDDISEIAQKLGYTTCENKDTVMISYIQNEPTINNKPAIKYYKGTIHCCQVDNGLIYVRVNGKAFWSHNSYAMSYQIQKAIEAMPGGTKPQLYFAGHFHQSLYMEYRNVHAFYAGCFEGASLWLQRKKLMPSVAGWMVTVGLDEDGSVKFVAPKNYKYYTPDVYK